MRRESDTLPLSRHAGATPAEPGARALDRRVVVVRARFHTVGAFVADAPGFVGRLRASPHFRRAVERLAAAGVLAGDDADSAVRDAHVGRVLTAGMFLGELEGFG